jgi:hypothetical protein
MGQEQQTGDEPSAAEVLAVVTDLAAPARADMIAELLDAGRPTRTDVRALENVLANLERDGRVKGRDRDYWRFVGVRVADAGRLWWTNDKWFEAWKQSEREAARRATPVDRGSESSALEDERAAGGSPLRKAVDRTLKAHEKHERELRRGDDWRGGW